MPEIDATPSQRAAIESRGSAVLVSAGAGSGKTRVLTERLLRWVEEGRDIDGFLVITFTRAAAAELRGRIMTMLAEKAAKDPSNRHLCRQSALCRRASIQTIDGFCSELLRQNCHLLGLAPDFRIIEDDRAAQMKAAALDRTMEEGYAHPEAHPGFLALADTVGAGRDDRRLCELVLELHGRMQCHARPDKWAAEMIEQLRAPVDDVSETPWGKELLKDLQARADYWSAELERVLALARADEKTRKCYGESLETGAEQLREFSRALRLGWDKARACELSLPRVGGVRNPTDPELTEYVKARRASCMDACKKMAKTLGASSKALLAGMALTHDAMEALLRLTLDFDAEYARAKRRASLLDYADLEHFAARLLTDESGAPTAFAREVSARFTEIMVDEYQDVSRVQDAIFRALSKDGRNLFLVGDVKQSIYRFRLADPEIFTEKYDGFRDFDKAAEGEARRILLRENFRSRREIVDAANAVFSRCMSRALGDVDYDDAAALRFGASYYQGCGEIPELLLFGAGRAEDEGETPDRLAFEAEQVARRIERLLREAPSVTTKEGERPLRCGDIAILLRTVANVGTVFRRALLRRGVPVAAARGGEFFSSLEVSTVVDLLALIDNPHQDVPLIAVLRSPVFGFTPDELSAIRAADKNADFYDALCLRAQSDGKCRAFLDRLGALRAAAPDLGCAELVWQIIGELDLLAIAAAMDEGERRRSDLMELVALSEDFESTGWRGLHRFVLWLRRLAVQGRDPESAAAPEGVQILSIHKSKGLEFPVVFLCDSARRFNMQERSGTVLVHPVLGLGPRVVDLERRVRYPSLARLAIARRAEREDLSEEMRLLYVAMTRAKERLFITAAFKDPEKTIEKALPEAQPPLAPETLSRAGSMAQWLLLAALADGGRHLGLQVCRADPERTEAPERPRPEADAEALGELRRRLSFRYPHEAAVELPSKVTATELKGRGERDADAEALVRTGPTPFRMPQLGQAGRPLSAAERGVATHLLLQYMDFGKGRSRAGIKAEIERLRDAAFLSPREAEAVNVSAVERLFASALGARMLAAREPLREFRFSLLLDAAELYPGAEGEELLLQGVVDCCLEEDDGLVVIDYKTDRVRTDEEIAARAEGYRGQLRAYAAALRRILGRPVKECVLFFLTPGTAVRVDVD